MWRRRAGLAAEGRLPSVQPLSLTPFDSSPSRGASGETVHFAGTAKASPTRSCWGRGQQDASGSEADAGSRNPGSGIASAMTERLDRWFTGRKH